MFGAVAFAFPARQQKIIVMKMVWERCTMFLGEWGKSGDKIACANCKKVFKGTTASVSFFVVITTIFQK